MRQDVVDVANKFTTLFSEREFLPSYLIQNRVMSISPDQLSRLAVALEAMTNAAKVSAQDGVQMLARKMPASEIAALLFIGRNPGIRLNDLAEHLRIGATTASSIVDRLVKLRLVNRARPDDDRRSLHLSLTSEGEVFNQQAIVEQEGWCRIMLEALDVNEREGFISAMAKIADRLRN